MQCGITCGGFSTAPTSTRLFHVATSPRNYRCAISTFDQSKSQLAHRTTALSLPIAPVSAIDSTRSPLDFLQSAKMAARKNPSTALPMSARPLPPLPKLRVRKPNKAELNPCIGIMSSVLGCWASSGYSAQGCQQLETSLRACMDARVSLSQPLRNSSGEERWLWPWGEFWLTENCRNRDSRRRTTSITIYRGCTRRSSGLINVTRRHLKIQHGNRS